MRHLDKYLALPEQARREFRAGLTPRETALLDRTILTQLDEHENQTQAEPAPVYTPHGAATDILQAEDTEIVCSGPAGTGKSRACLEKLHGAMLANPGAKALIVRKTAVSLGASALRTFDEIVAKHALEHGHVEYFGGSTKEPASYRYANGSRIVVGGMDKATKIMSTEYDLVFAQEAIELTEKDWQSLTTRLRNGRLDYHQLIGDTNPGPPTHWLKTRCDEGRARMIHCRHTDNPTLWNHKREEWTKEGEAYRAVLENLTGVYRSWYLEGKWVGAEGLVWPSWDESTHLIDPIDIPEDWPRVWVIDFGFTNPFVCQHWAIDPDGRAHRYREWYGTQRLVEDWARHILEVVAPDSAWQEPRPTAVVCDHDAEGRATFEKHTGLRTTTAVKKRGKDSKVTGKAGIQEVESRLKAAGDGKPRILLHRGALVERDEKLAAAKKPTCTEQEVPGYVWPKGVDGKPLKEEPVKEDDHGCDAMRYLAMHLDGPRKSARVRFL